MGHSRPLSIFVFSIATFFSFGTVYRHLNHILHLLEATALPSVLQPFIVLFTSFCPLLIKFGSFQVRCNHTRRDMTATSNTGALGVICAHAGDSLLYLCSIISTASDALF